MPVRVLLSGAAPAKHGLRYQRDTAASALMRLPISVHTMLGKCDFVE